MLLEIGMARGTVDKGIDLRVFSRVNHRHAGAARS